MGGAFVCVCPSSRQVATDEEWAVSQPELDRQLRDVRPVTGSSKVLICQNVGLVVMEAASALAHGVALAFVGCDRKRRVCIAYGELSQCTIAMHEDHVRFFC